jgi:hypothetical protein
MACQNFSGVSDRHGLLVRRGTLTSSISSEGASAWNSLGRRRSGRDCIKATSRGIEVARVEAFQAAKARRCVGSSDTRLAAKLTRETGRLRNRYRTQCRPGSSETAHTDVELIGVVHVAVRIESEHADTVAAEINSVMRAP